MKDIVAMAKEEAAKEWTSAVENGFKGDYSTFYAGFMAGMSLGMRIAIQVIAVDKSAAQTPERET